MQSAYKFAQHMCHLSAFVHHAIVVSPIVWPMMYLVFISLATCT